MRFGIPRSNSPSPVRGAHRTRWRSSTFGVQSSSDGLSSSEETEGLESEAYDSDSSTSLEGGDGDDRGRGRGLKVLMTRPAPLTKDKALIRTGLTRPHGKGRSMNEIVTAIRLRTRHYDPYEEWSKQTRLDAVRTARKTQHIIQCTLQDERSRARAEELDRLAAQHSKQMAEVEERLSALRMKHQAAESKLKDAWAAREQQLWERIERVIQLEEEKVRKSLEEEQRAKEEGERRKEEERKKQEEEMARELEEEMARREMLEAQKKAEEELADVQKREENEEKLAKEQRARLGLTTAMEDWAHGRYLLKHVKAGPMVIVKSDPELKATWNALRRQITPKIGQLTNDGESMRIISQQICDIVNPNPPHSEPLYFALLSSLSKAILLQAETEVTAEKKSAIPLSIVTAHLLQRLPGFDEILWAKLIQRTGGWAVPIAIPKDADGDGTLWENAAQRRKAMGYRDGESESEYVTRISGIMRVYFMTMWAPVEIDQPLEKLYQTPRFWMWFSRVLRSFDGELVETAAGAEVIAVALEVGGNLARAAWGLQWDKLLRLLEQALKAEGELDEAGKPKRIIGGQSPEGKAARVRVELEIENILGRS